MKEGETLHWDHPIALYKNTYNTLNHLRSTLELFCFSLAYIHWHETWKYPNRLKTGIHPLSCLVYIIWPSSVVPQPLFQGLAYSHCPEKDGFLMLINFNVGLNPLLQFWLELLQLLDTSDIRWHRVPHYSRPDHKGLAGQACLHNGYS